MRAENEQVRTRSLDLRNDFVVRKPRLLKTEIHGYCRRYARGKSPHLGHEPFTIDIVQHQRRKVHRRDVREYVQDREPRVVPACDGCCVSEGVL